MNKLSPIKGKTMKNEKGMVLVLAIFMLALLSMIGLSSMMTSTTDITIAGNERSSKTVYYQAESGLTIGGEVARLFYYAGKEDGLTTVEEIIDNATNMALKNSGFDDAWEKTTNKLWVKNDQTLDRVDDAEPDLQLSGDDLNVNIDIDMLYTAPLEGSSLKWRNKGVKQNRYVYNVEALARLPQNSSIMADHVMGYHIYVNETN
jgi:Tfp pilus assembly protein PilX